MKKCNCKITSDGCRYCQPQEYIDYLEKYITDLQDKHLIRYDKNDKIMIFVHSMLLSNIDFIPIPIINDENDLMQLMKDKLNKITKLRAIR